MASEEVFFERLSGLDTAFLAAETGGVHMHIAGLLRFGRSQFSRDDGSVDIEALTERAVWMVEGDLRLRQRISWVPGLRHPYWIDDQNFRLGYHVRHTSLPRPGNDEQLKRLMGRILSQRLDRDKPLWEFWVVEGLEDGGFAIIMKVHHCVMDGMGAMSMLMRVVAGVPGKGEVPAPRPAPNNLELLEAEARHRGRSFAELRLFSADWDATPARDPDAADGIDLFSGAKALSDLILRRSPRTQLNPSRMSGHRRFETLSVPFSGIRRVRKAYETKVNDVVLAIVTGGLRRYLQRNGVEPADLKPFRALVPANTRSKAASGKLGNSVGLLMAELPIDVDDPFDQLELIHETTEFLKKESNEVDSTKWLSDIDDKLGLGLMSSAIRWGSRLVPFNVTVTNVPGPPMAVNAFGSPLKALYGAVPLTFQQGLGITLFSYAGELHFGVQADLDAIEDLDQLRDDLHAAYEALCGAPGEQPGIAPPAADPPERAKSGEAPESSAKAQPKAAKASKPATEASDAPPAKGAPATKAASRRGGKKKAATDQAPN